MTQPRQDPGPTTGALHVVATPIGNLGDLTVRAAETLRTADLVLSEDTRRTGRLLAHVGSHAPQRSLHEHNERERVDEVVARVAGGATVALVTDAGTPLVSDPGLAVVRGCVAAGLPVVPVPGASAPLAALVASGLPPDRFPFEGFLPRRGRARAERLAELADEPRTAVLFVAPHRAAADLADLAAACGDDRPAVLCRELTKLHEEVRRGTLGALRDGLGEVRGEVTLVLGGAPAPVAPAAPGAADLGAVAERVAEGASTRDAVAAVAAARGLPRRALYAAVLAAAAGPEEDA
ncbi:MAG: 16S rRNA (cytidine(1402)-2'-O)-methyltransferase [Nitriliruptoraceae bacterium]